MSDLHLGSLLAEKEPQCALNRRLPVHWSWSGCCSAEKSLVPLSRIKPLFLGYGYSACWVVTGDYTILSP
jgi:hypothetical protein